MSRPTVICLCPTKNEAHNLPRFLASASLWADVIIIADQNSTDGSQDIVARYPKARLVVNPSPKYDEELRTKLLLAEARKIPGPRALFTFDADEIITSEVLASPRWEEVLRLPPGTVLWFEWANLMPGFKRAYRSDSLYPWGFIDNGREHKSWPIHAPRIPILDTDPRVELKEFPVLHYSAVDWERHMMKQRWYQCWETLNSGHIGPLLLYRRYHAVGEVADEQWRPFEERWIEGYEAAGIPMREVIHADYAQWERAIAGWLEEHGPRRFARVDIWDVDWDARFEAQFGRPPKVPLKDPRNAYERFIFRWMDRTQPYWKKIWVRVIQRALRATGW
jgi:glycosyltransferase involved in cell wall biosynthesis